MFFVVVAVFIVICIMWTRYYTHGYYVRNVSEGNTVIQQLEIGDFIRQESYSYADGITEQQHGYYIVRDIIIGKTSIPGNTITAPQIKVERYPDGVQKTFVIDSKYLQGSSYRDSSDYCSIEIIRDPNRRKEAERDAILLAAIQEEREQRAEAERQERLRQEQARNAQISAHNDALVNEYMSKHGL